MASIGTRLYRGELGYDFIGSAKRWYAVSAIIVLICLGSMLFRGFNFGIEFEGGNSFQFPGTEQQVDEVQTAVEGLGVEVVSNQVVGGNALLLRTPELDNEAAAEVASAVAETLGIDANDVSESAVSARWGGDITAKALQALVVFLIAVVIFIAIRFQPKMAVAAVGALIHDLIATAGIYSLVGFEVTPSTVIGLLTILGFSLYDTVVVFDKVDENTRGILGGSRITYSGAANLAVNQTLMRSINTSLIALLPVAGLLFVGAGLLGAGTLKDLALVLFVGLATGAYSSIFLATPILCHLKEREPAYAALRKRVEARTASGRGGDTGTGAPARVPAKVGARAGTGNRPGRVQSPNKSPNKSLKSPNTSLKKSPNRSPGKPGTTASGRVPVQTQGAWPGAGTAQAAVGGAGPAPRRKPTPTGATAVTEKVTTEKPATQKPATQKPVTAEEPAPQPSARRIRRPGAAATAPPVDSEADSELADPVGTDPERTDAAAEQADEGSPGTESMSSAGAASPARPSAPGRGTGTRPAAKSTPRRGGRPSGKRKR